ncbi:neuferricin homolog [Sitodiplosis mosellana]|uniref:neuferricin homolog n=1 Tax=Sitodiplosis mosellana TaxID=263140 RepID=UPI0024452AD9|nr:neuferricin homolog [Sitodiplosis mosellana]
MISFLVHFLRQHFFIILCCVVTAFLWPELRKHFVNEYEQYQTRSESDVRLFTREELTQFDGIHNKELYLSILGSVYDVSKGLKHYGPGGTYNYFVGKDASVAFITGDFEKDPNSDYEDDDVLKHLKAQEIYSIHQWKQFYEKDYIFLGLLTGRFYGYDGEKTDYMKKVDEQIEIAIAEKEKHERLRVKYPPCNIEWKAETGTRVWCTSQSGGIDRDFVGVPRRFYEVGKSEFRCACVPDDRLEDPLLKGYDDCDPKSVECFYVVD